MDENAPTSIIIPTYHEAGNISTLIKKIASVHFNNRAFEVIIVDDCSDDGTASICHSLMPTHPWLKLIVRHGKQKNLSQSVLDGFAVAQYPLLIVMDADLSHPPETIPAMLRQVEKPDIDMVIGSRYIKGGSTETQWPWHRKKISAVCALLARATIMASVRDPLSGFFALKKETLQQAQNINPIGWKIGLELMAKCHCKHIMEIPIHFADRKHGKSKFSMRIAISYLKHLLLLLKFKYAKAN